MKTIYDRLISNPSVTSSGTLSKSKSSYEAYDFASYANQFKSSDFDITSILSVGAFDMLNPTFVSSSNTFDVVDSFQSVQNSKSK